MAVITFFGKLNCINNNKQKSLLKAAGHVLDDRDILDHPWTVEQLRSYFGQMPVGEWFNVNAPAIKSKTFVTDGITEQQALEAMLHDPYLIRRPLMEIGGQKICGFRYEQLDGMVGLSPIAGHEKEAADLRSQNITTCPFKNEDNCDNRESVK